MAKYYRTYVVEIDLDAWKKELVDDGFSEVTEEDILKMCSDYDIEDLAWWHGVNKYEADVAEEHIEK